MAYLRLEREKFLSCILTAIINKGDRIIKETVENSCLVKTSVRMSTNFVFYYSSYQKCRLTKILKKFNKFF